MNVPASQPWSDPPDGSVDDSSCTAGRPLSPAGRSYSAVGYRLPAGRIPVQNGQCAQKPSGRQEIGGIGAYEQGVSGQNVSHNHQELPRPVACCGLYVRDPGLMHSPTASSNP